MFMTSSHLCVVCVCVSVPVSGGLKHPEFGPTYSLLECAKTQR